MLCLEAICSLAERAGGTLVHFQPWFNAKAKAVAKRVVLPSPGGSPDGDRPRPSSSHSASQDTVATDQPEASLRSPTYPVLGTGLPADEPKMYFT